MAERDTLALNADLKFTEFVLHMIDDGTDDLTLGEIRKRFHEKFAVPLDARLNQYWGLIRIVPLMHMYEHKKNIKSDPDWERIVSIRNAFAHNDFSFDREGYMFTNKGKGLSVSYQEFMRTLHRIENDFYHLLDRIDT